MKKHRPLERLKFRVDMRTVQGRRAQQSVRPVPAHLQCTAPNSVRPGLAGNSGGQGAQISVRLLPLPVQTPRFQESSSRTDTCVHSVPAGAPLSVHLAPVFYQRTIQGRTELKTRCVLLACAELQTRYVLSVPGAAKQRWLIFGALYSLVKILPISQSKNCMSALLPRARVSCHPQDLPDVVREVQATDALHLRPDHFAQQPRMGRAPRKRSQYPRNRWR